MGWSLGWDSNWGRDIGYGVPAVCDHPNCSVEIHRGLAYVCGSDVRGGKHGCGLFFCDRHRSVYERGDTCVALCSRCGNYKPSYKPKEDTHEWVEHKLKHESWGIWRHEHPKKVVKLKERYRVAHKWIDEVERGRIYEDRARQRKALGGKKVHSEGFVTLAGELAARLDEAGLEILDLKKKLAAYEPEVKVSDEQKEPERPQSSQVEAGDGPSSPEEAGSGT